MALIRSIGLFGTFWTTLEKRGPLLLQSSFHSHDNRAPVGRYISWPSSRRALTIASHLVIAALRNVLMRCFFWPIQRESNKVEMMHHRAAGAEWLASCVFHYGRPFLQGQPHIIGLRLISHEREGRKPVWPFSCVRSLEH
jgi:hypothetical protein